jgi:peptide/nickel transport system ATP-binding protein
MTTSGAVLEAVDLTKDFSLSHGLKRSRLRAVDEVSFRLDRKKVVALVGESGSGKSTVARMLAGQESLTKGHVHLDGLPVDLRNARAYRAYKAQVQMIFQDPFASLNSAHTVQYHLRRPLQLYKARVKTGPIQEQLTRLLEQVRLVPSSEFLPKYPHELSGGQRQRVAIARAIAVEPKVLLADEPVSMLDVSIRLEILSLLDVLRDRLELAMLYVTHDIASARYFADQILVMYAGRIVERGPAEDVTQRPAHPYTQLLVASAPDPDDLGNLAPVAGRSINRTTKSPASVEAAGCPFWARCPLAQDRCRDEKPRVVPVGADRSAACWRADEAMAMTGLNPANVQVTAKAEEVVKRFPS